MEMLDIKLQVPKDLLKAMKSSDAKLEKTLWEKIVLELYREETISFGKACELLALSKWEFADLLKEKEVPLPYDETDLEEDLKTMKDLNLW